MRCGQQFPATKFQIKAINILLKHPGLNAEGFAAICYPSWQRAGWLGALKLWPLTKKGLVKIRWEPPMPFEPPYRRSKIKPSKRYYVTDKGFAVHESYRRQGYSEDGDPPDANGER